MSKTSYNLKKNDFFNYGKDEKDDKYYKNHSEKLKADTLILFNKFWNCIQFIYWIIVILIGICFIILTGVILSRVFKIERLLDDLHETFEMTTRFENKAATIIPESLLKSVVPNTTEEMAKLKMNFFYILENFKGFSEQLSKSTLLTSIAVLLDNFAYYTGTREFSRLKVKMEGLLIKTIDFIESDAQFHVSMRQILSLISGVEDVQEEINNDGGIESREYKFKKRPQEKSAISDLIDIFRHLASKPEFYMIYSEIKDLIPELSIIFKNFNALSSSEETSDFVLKLKYLIINIIDRYDENDAQLFVTEILATNVSKLAVDLSEMRQSVSNIEHQVSDSKLIFNIGKVANITGNVLADLKKSNIVNELKKAITPE